MYHNRQRHTLLYGGRGGRFSGSMLLLLSYAASVLVDQNLQCDPGVVVECIYVGALYVPIITGVSYLKSRYINSVQERRKTGLIYTLFR